MQKEQEKNILVGIDFGAKMAGTTVITYLQGEKFVLFASEKNKDADTFIESFFESTFSKELPSVVCIDAPLSLPGVYRGLEGYDDYFYRRADRALNAMSPMFLGGLTARAMRLHNRLKASGKPNGISLVETYPAEHARRLGLKAFGYKEQKVQISSVVEVIHTAFADVLPLPSSVFHPILFSTWHHVDALLALLAASRIQSGIEDVFGDNMEGKIVL
jgi:predicted nuclease with RNAse H fold